MLDITNEDIFRAGTDWYEWKYMKCFWQSAHQLWLLKNNMKEMC